MESVGDLVGEAVADGATEQQVALPSDAHSMECVAQSSSEVCDRFAESVDGDSGGIGIEHYKSFSRNLIKRIYRSFELG